MHLLWPSLGSPDTEPKFVGPEHRSKQLQTTWSQVNPADSSRKRLHQRNLEDGWQAKIGYEGAGDDGGGGVEANGSGAPESGGS